MWIDPRKLSSCIVKVSMIAGLFACGLVSMAVGQAVPASPDAPVRVSELLRAQWWTISGLLGLVAVLVGVIVMREWNSTKVHIRDLHREKLGIVEHSMIDHSPLCAVCRDKHLATDRRMGGDRRKE